MNDGQFDPATSGLGQEAQAGTGNGAGRFTTYVWGPEFQRKILKLAITGDLIARSAGAFQAKFFGPKEGRLKTPRQRIAELVERFTLERGEHPGIVTMDELVHGLAATLPPESRAGFDEEWAAVRAAEVPDPGYVTDRVRGWAQLEALARAVYDGAGLLERLKTGDAGGWEGVGPEVRRRVDEALQIGTAQPRLASPATWRAQPLSALLAEPDAPIPYLIERLMVAECSGWIGGEPKSLKSWAALHLALCLSTGAPAFGRYAVPERVRVLYLQEEDSRRRVRHRVGRLLTGMGVAPPEDAFFRVSIKAGLLLDDPTWVDWLRRELDAYGPAVVIGDVFEKMHMKDRNKEVELKPVLYQLDRLREEHGCGFTLVDHFKKTVFGASGRGGQRLAGTVQKHAWGECSLYLFPGTKKNSARVETELKDGASEAFGLTLDDLCPAEGARSPVAFTWHAPEDEEAAETKGKMVAFLAGLPQGAWVLTSAVAEAVGCSPDTAKKHLHTLVAEDKALGEKRKGPGGEPWHWQLRRA